MSATTAASLNVFYAFICMIVFVAIVLWVRRQTTRRAVNRVISSTSPVAMNIITVS
jgi:hypothetical protein